MTESEYIWVPAATRMWVIHNEKLPQCHWAGNWIQAAQKSSVCTEHLWDVIVSKYVKLIHGDVNKVLTQSSMDN